MSTHNICFYGELTKIILQLSSNTLLICSTVGLLQYENFNNLTNLVNLNDMAKKINDLTKLTTEVYNFTDMADGELPRFLNFTLWSDIMETVSNWSMDPEKLAQCVSLLS